MSVPNKYSGWYGEYKKRKEPENLSPYRIVRIVNDVGEPINSLKDFRVNAVSPKQAWFLLWKDHPDVVRIIQDYKDAGYVIELELDAEGLRQKKQLEELDRQREQANRQQKEEDIQNAWWNK